MVLMKVENLEMKINRFLRGCIFNVKNNVNSTVTSVKILSDMPANNNVFHSSGKIIMTKEKLLKALSSIQL